MKLDKTYQMKASKSILLVEDDKDDQFFFMEAISEIENVTLYDIANNGQEALDKLENVVSLPDLIFSDINMPVMNGIDCLAGIIKNPHTRHIPVIILTTDLGTIDITRQLGAKAFIQKPANIASLRNQIEQMVNLDFIANDSIANHTFKNASRIG